jgi:hypothetical protein
MRATGPEALHIPYFYMLGDRYKLWSSLLRNFHYYPHRLKSKCSAQRSVFVHTQTLFFRQREFHIHMKEQGKL